MTTERSDEGAYRAVLHLLSILWTSMIVFRKIKKLAVQDPAATAAALATSRGSHSLGFPDCLILEIARNTGTCQSVRLIGRSPGRAMPDA
jgi:hypothetical protein